MSPEEWNERYPGLDGQVVELPEGWYSLVIELLDSLAKLKGWSHSSVTQIKEKFGGLRFYFDGGSADYEETQHIIAIAEQKSWSLCQKCGAEGATQVNVKRGWSLKTPPGPGPVSTLCSSCATAEDAT